MIHDIFDVPNTAFSTVLVLMVRFTSAGFNTVHLKSIFGFLTGSNVSIITNRYSIAPQFMIFSSSV